MKQYYVYIVASHSRNIYTGFSSNLQQRIYQHKNKLAEGFTKQYNIDQLVYYETAEDVYAAIRREKQIKGWTRAKKVVLIESINPFWQDLSADWF